MCVTAIDEKKLSIFLSDMPDLLPTFFRSTETHDGRHPRCPLYWGLSRILRRQQFCENFFLGSGKTTIPHQNYIKFSERASVEEPHEQQREHNPNSKPCRFPLNYCASLVLPHPVSGFREVPPHETTTKPHAQPTNVTLRLFRCIFVGLEVLDLINGLVDLVSL
jgi:hypothetical protein